MKSFLEIRYKGIGFSLYTKKLVVKFLLYRLIFDTHFYIRIEGDKRAHVKNKVEFVFFLF
ncbi:hypothetical protein DWW18_14680 [Butyricimonas virosa]|uniref:Uncharacterized protein n=1 Tax=Butyricimonas virosa TaxID=544645 RepID=A0A412WX85_9BACT|nr:hypothetical protein DWW18_14680 [Butyricimonas virosa]